MGDQYKMSTKGILQLHTDKKSTAAGAVSVAAVALLGLSANNRGALGLIPVVTTALYTVVCLYARRTRAIKLNLIVNLLLWAVYELFIMDLVSCVVDTVSAGAAAASLLRGEPEDRGTSA